MPIPCQQPCPPNRRTRARIGLLSGVLLLTAGAWVRAGHPAYAYHHPPPPRHVFPAITNFFAYGAYAIGPSGYVEFWNKAHLGRTTTQAWDRHYRHLILHNLNFFGNNVGQRPRIDRQLQLAAKYGGKHDFHRFVGYLRDTFTGKLTGYTRWPLDEVVQRWTDLVRPHADNPHVLYWRIYDEIAGYRDYEQEHIFTLKEELYRIDTNHPISFIEHGGPSPVTSQLEYGMGECYAFYGVARNGKDLSECESFLRENWESFRHQTVRQCILWTAGYGEYEPTPTDLRAQVFHMLAAGWNSLAFYYAPIKMPAWAHWTQNDPHANRFVTHKLVDFGLSNNFEYETDILREASRLGEKIVPLGHLFLQGTYDPDSAHTVTGDTAPLERSFADPESGRWVVTNKQVSAIGLGVWKHPDAELLVVYNRDLQSPRAGRVEPTGPAADRAVHDLLTGQTVPVTNGQFAVQFPPGGGGLFLLATPEGLARHRREILRRTYEHASNKLRIRLDVAQGTGRVDVRTAVARLEEGKRAHADHDYAAACERLGQARAAWVTATAADPAYGVITNALREASDRLWEIDLWLKRRVPILAAPAEDLGSWTYTPPLGAGRPALNQILNEIRALGVRYFPLAEGFETGKNVTPGAFAKYAADLRRARDRLRAYRPSAGLKTKVAFLASGDHWDADAWRFLTLTVPNGTRVHLRGDGHFQNAAGNAVALTDFDVLWWHYARPSGNASLDTAGRIAVPEAWLAEDTVRQCKAFVAAGRGLLLTGLAPAYLVALGLEETEPNVVEVGASRFIRPGFKTLLNHQGVGLRPRPALRTHPVFRGLDTDVMLYGDTAAIPVTRASWAYPVIPRQGTVLAGLSTLVLPPPDRYHYDLLEYAHGQGRVLACGLPKLRFDVRFKRNDVNRERFNRLRRFMDNVLGYLGSNARALRAEEPVRGPFYHRDFARASSNLGLRVRASSGKLSGAPFDDKTGAFHKWDVRTTPAWIEIDFGCPIEIGKIHLLNHWVSHTSWSISQFRVKIWDDARSEFVDSAPPLVYRTDDRYASYRGITFTFEPVPLPGSFTAELAPLRTTKLRIEGLDGVYFNDPDNPERKGVSLAHVIVYGREFESEPDE